MRNSLLNKAVLSSLSLLGLSSLSAVADEEIRIAQRGYPAQPGTFQVNVPAGQRVDLEAEALVDGQAVAELTSALQWHVACPDARLPCAPEAFTVTEGGRGRSFQVPLEGGFQEIQLVVSGTDGANATFDLHVGSDQAAPASQTESLPGATAAYPHYQSGFHRPSLTDSAAPADEPAPRRRGSRFSNRASAESSASSAAASAVGAVGTSGGAGTAGGASRGTGAGTVDASFNRYYAEGGGGVSGAAASEAVRAYVPGRSVAVVSCAKKAGADGRLHLSCEKTAKKRLKLQANRKTIRGKAKTALAAAKKKKSSKRLVAKKISLRALVAANSLK